MAGLERRASQHQLSWGSTTRRTGTHLLIRPARSGIPPPPPMPGKPGNPPAAGAAPALGAETDAEPSPPSSSGMSSSSSSVGTRLLAVAREDFIVAFCEGGRGRRERTRPEAGKEGQGTHVGVNFEPLLVRLHSGPVLTGAVEGVAEPRVSLGEFGVDLEGLLGVGDGVSVRLQLRVSSSTGWTGTNDESAAVHRGVLSWRLSLLGRMAALSYRIEQTQSPPVEQGAGTEYTLHPFSAVGGGPQRAPLSPLAHCFLHTLFGTPEHPTEVDGLILGSLPFPISPLAAPPASPTSHVQNRLHRSTLAPRHPGFSGVPPLIPTTRSQETLLR